MKAKVSLALFLVFVISLTSSILNYAYVSSSKTTVYGYVWDDYLHTPIASADVRLCFSSGVSLYTKTDSNGYYKFEFNFEDPLFHDSSPYLEAIAPDYHSYGYNPILSPGESKRCDIYLTPYPMVTVSGYILDKNSSKAIPQVSIHFFGTYSSYTTTSDSNGYYVVRIRKDNYRITLEKEDYVTVQYSIDFTNAGDKANQNFYMQRTTYKLSVVSSFGNTQGSGYYYSGTNVTFSVSPSYVQTEDTRATFISWSSTNGYSGTKNPAYVVMPKSSVEEYANWKVEYKVKVYDNFGKLIKEDWVLNGSSYTVSVDDCIAFNNGTRLKFSYWRGDVSGSQNPTTITVSSPKVITAVYVRQYYLKLLTNYSSAIGEFFFSILGYKFILQNLNFL